MNKYNTLKWAFLFLFVILLLVTINSELSVTRRLTETQVDSLLRVVSEIGYEVDYLKKNVRLPAKFVKNVLEPLAFAESSFNPKAVSPDGKAFGYFQIQLRTAREVLDKTNLTVDDLYNPYVNPFLAVLILEKLHKQQKQLHFTLAAYNGALRKTKDGRDTITNASYIKKILRKF